MSVVGCRGGSTGPFRLQCPLVYDDLYRASWQAQSQFLRDGIIGPSLLWCATPVLAFGRWQTAQVVTAGLNPSEREFLDEGNRELDARARRFLHRTGSGEEDPSDFQIAEARALAEQYFELGNAYTGWFDGFKPLLDELGCSYDSGRACHTDYRSPFATAAGLGKVAPSVQQALAKDGLARWKAILELTSECRVVLGIGAGWKDVPAALGFSRWHPVETLLDDKGGGTKSPRPHFLSGQCVLGGRPVHIFWWRPNRGEPLTYLDHQEKRWLARRIRELSGFGG